MCASCMRACTRALAVWMPSDRCADAGLFCYQAFWDATGGLWGKGALAGKYAGVFVSSGTPGGGQGQPLPPSYLSHSHLTRIYTQNRPSSRRSRPSPTTAFSSSRSATARRSPSLPTSLRCAADRRGVRARSLALTAAAPPRPSSSSSRLPRASSSGRQSRRFLSEFLRYHFLS